MSSDKASQSVEQARELVERAYEAQKTLATFSQEKIDDILAVMARAEGLGTGQITLYMFGGLASLNGQPAQPMSEFKIAIVGPAASFLIGMIAYLVVDLFIQGTPHRAVGQVLRHLSFVNWFLAGFNILPGLPLDGGRVFRALMWKLNKNFRAATQLAVRSGLMIAMTLILTGIYYFLKAPDYGITGIWLALTCWVAARSALLGRRWASRGWAVAAQGRTAPISPGTNTSS